MIRLVIRFESTRYLISAGACALLNNVVLILGDRAGLSYPVLLALTWVLGGSLGYALHTRFTFDVSPGLGAYARFMGGVALGVPTTALLLYFFGKLLMLPMWITAPTTTVIMVIYNYLNARLAILWRRRKARI